MHAARLQIPSDSLRARKFHTVVRQTCAPRSAELDSAVSPICNRRSGGNSNAPNFADTRQDAILRYGRVQLCATRKTSTVPRQNLTPAASNARLSWLARAILLWLAITAAHACSIPVFRYALDRWDADAYQLEIAASAANDPTLAPLFRNLGNSSPLNLRLVAPADNRPTESRLLFPGYESSVWSGVLDAATFSRLTQSPARAEVARRLLSGDSGVWILLESGQKDLDDAEALRLEKRMTFLKTVAALPRIDPTDPTSRLGPGPELQVGFSLLRLAAGDPGEAVLRTMLLGPKPERPLPENGPIAAVVFGRGRVLGAWPTKNLGDESIDEACLFLLGACSCQVKRLNPGWDLLLSVDWPQALMAAAARTAPDEDQSTGGESPPVAATETVTIQPKAIRAQDGSADQNNSWHTLLLLSGSGVLIGLAFLLTRYGRRFTP
jgi:hypothetical protein